MPIVANSAAEYELKRQKMIDELEAQSNVRKMIIKSQQHLKDTGSTLYQPQEVQSTIESMLDANKLDQNLESKLKNELNSNSGNAKAFIQSLDDNLKVLLLDRFPIYVKTFSKNFFTPSSMNLKAAYELFSKELIKQDEDISLPTRDVIIDYLGDLSDQRLQKLGREIHMITFPTEDIRTYNNWQNSVSKNELVGYIQKELIAVYIREFSTELEGFMSLYSHLKKFGFDDLPKIKLNNDGTIPKPYIKAPLTTGLSGLSAAAPTSPPSTPVSSFTPASTPPTTTASVIDYKKSIEKKYGTDHLHKGTANMKKKDIGIILSKYDAALDDKFPDPSTIPNFMPKKIASADKKSYETAIKSLIARKYNIFTEKFDVLDMSPISPAVATPMAAVAGSGLFKHIHLIKKHVPGYVRIY